MADYEKLTALKKAYADIMLNTAKESAARIMVSERKAQRYRRELFAAKDEALRMLLRLKQMLDAKVNEAEMTTLSQQRKIEELEAQLGEAEDIVKDLRVELQQLQDELERVIRNQKQPLGVQTPEGGVATHEMELEEKILCSSLPAAHCTITTVHEIKNSILDGICDVTPCYSDNCFHQNNSFDFNPDLASIMLRSKEPELYKNGCTQRIRAFERNRLDGNGSLCGQADGSRNQVSNGEGKEGSKKCKEVSSVNNNMFDGDTGPYEAKVVPADDDCLQVHPVRSSKRKTKRVMRSKKRKALLFKEISYQGDNVLSGEDSQKDRETFLPSISSSNKNESILQSRSLATKCDSDFLRACTGQDVVKNDKLLSNELTLSEKEAVCTEVSECPGNKPAIEVDSVLLVNSDPKEADASEAPASQQMDNKFLKCTFQRKLLDGNASLCGQADGSRNQVSEGKGKEGSKKCKEVSTVNNNMFDGDTSPYEAKVVPADDDCFQVHAVSSFKRKTKRVMRSKKHRALLFKEISYQGDNVLSGEDSQKDRETFLPSISSSNANESILQSRSLATKCDSDFLSTFTGQDIVKNDKLLSNELTLSGKEAVCTEVSECPGNKPAIEVDSVLLINSDPKEADASEALASQQMDNKFLKYTFQRKRKKEGPSSPDGESSLDSSTSARKVEEKKSDIMVAQKPSLLTELSRDSRRVAQVARQLISLSEKKWHS